MAIWALSTVRILYSKDKVSCFSFSRVLFVLIPQYLRNRILGGMFSRFIYLYVVSALEDINTLAVLSLNLDRCPKVGMLVMTQ